MKLKLKSVVLVVLVVLCLGALPLLKDLYYEALGLFVECVIPNKEDCIEACAKGDFETAHKILEGFDTRYEKNEYYQCFDYVYRQELEFVVAEMNGKEANDKVAFLLGAIPPLGVPNGNSFEKEDYQKWIEHYDALCDVVLNLAINRKNNDLAQTALLHYKQDSKKDAAKQKYEEAVALGVFE